MTIVQGFNNDVEHRTIAWWSTILCRVLTVQRLSHRLMFKRLAQKTRILWHALRQKGGITRIATNAGSAYCTNR